jgi:hypothetical protein
MSSNAYNITGAIRDRRGRLTHVQLDEARVYPVADVMAWIRDGLYTFYTTHPDGSKTQVSVRGKKFMVTQGNQTKEDNLDYLNVPALI